MLLNYTRRQGLHLAWWGWLLTVLGFLYAVFVLEVIADFWAEGSPQAALVMGITMGIIAVIWGVLLVRFVFSHSTKNKGEI